LVRVGVEVRVEVDVLVGPGVKVAVGVQVGGKVGWGVGVIVGVLVAWAKAVAAMAVAREGLNGLKGRLGCRKRVAKQISDKIIKPTNIANKIVVILLFNRIISSSPLIYSPPTSSAEIKV
jgi:hypothetical protein